MLSVWSKDSGECACEFEDAHKSSGFWKGTPVSPRLEVQGILRVPPPERTGHTDPGLQGAQ